MDKEKCLELGVPFPNEKEYQNLLKEDAEQTDYPKSVII